MATETVSPVIDPARIELARQASCEIEAIVHMLNRERINDPDPISHAQVLRMGLVRIKDLNSVVMTVTGDDDLVTTADLDGVVNGNLEAAA